MADVLDFTANVVKSKNDKKKVGKSSDALPGPVREIKELLEERRRNKTSRDGDNGHNLKSKTYKEPPIPKKLNLSENAIRVLEKRYLLKDNTGNIIETPEQMFRRVAKCIAAVEKRYDKNFNVKQLEDSFYRMMTSLEFIPNSPTLMNAGKRSLPPTQRVDDAFMTLMHSLPTRPVFLSAMEGVVVSPRMLWFAMTAGRA